MLLTIENPKTRKGESLGYLTGIIYMMPNLQLCPNSKKAGCFDTCLVNAGRGVFGNVKTARQKRSDFLVIDKEGFFNQLIKEIIALEKKAEKLGLIPAIRLNGTSDIDYTRELASGQCTIFELFPKIQFYDYSKRIYKTKHDNHHITYSYSSAPEYSYQLNRMLETGNNIAVVFDTPKGKDLPLEFLGRKVIDGDLHDLRFLDAPYSIVGLRAKGTKEAKKASNFVIDSNLIAIY